VLALSGCNCISFIQDFSCLIFTLSCCYLEILNFWTKCSIFWFCAWPYTFCIWSWSLTWEIPVSYKQEWLVTLQKFYLASSSHSRAESTAAYHRMPPHWHMQTGWIPSVYPAKEDTEIGGPRWHIKILYSILFYIQGSSPHTILIFLLLISINLDKEFILISVSWGHV
jgi:hypothetical protein